jgi:hypothetical protein
MQNIAMRRDGNRLLIEIDLTQTGHPSKSGKTSIIATSSGNQPVPGSNDTVIGLNCFRYSTPRPTRPSRS